MPTLQQQNSAAGPMTSFAESGKTELLAHKQIDSPISIQPLQRNIKRSDRLDLIRVLTFDRPGSSANIYGVRPPSAKLLTSSST